MGACVGRRFVKVCGLAEIVGQWREDGSRFLANDPPKLTPGKAAVTPISDDGTVTKMGHPDLLWD
jgi:hypothetical protein